MNVLQRILVPCNGYNYFYLFTQTSLGKHTTHTDVKIYLHEPKRLLAVKKLNL